MIRINFSIIIAAIVLAGCNPPAEVVSPSTDPTPVVDIDTSIEAAQDGSTVIFNKPLSAPLEISGFKCTFGTCLFNKLEFQHSHYNKETGYAYDKSLLQVIGSNSEGHGLILKKGTTLNQLWVRGQNSRILFESDVAIAVLTLDGQETGGINQPESEHKIANAAQSDRCLRSSSQIELCTGISDTSDTSNALVGNVEIGTIQISGNNNVIDLRYGAKNHINTNATANRITQGTPGHIVNIAMPTNSNTLYLCGRTVGTIDINGSRNKVYVSSIADIDTIVLGQTSGTLEENFDTSECGTNAIRP